MRDIDTARSIVRVVLEPIMALDEIGTMIVSIDDVHTALDQAAEAVADLLDPDEVFEFEVG